MTLREFILNRLIDVQHGHDWPQPALTAIMERLCEPDLALTEEQRVVLYRAAAK